MKRPKTKKELALCRVALSCKIGKDVLEGKGVIPAGMLPEDWIWYQLFSAIADLAMAMGETEQEGKQ